MKIRHGLIALSVQLPLSCLLLFPASAVARYGPRHAPLLPRGLFAVDTSQSDHSEYGGSSFHPSETEPESHPEGPSKNPVDTAHTKMGDGHSLCTICQTEMEKDEVTREAGRCGHHFHYDCLAEFEKQNKMMGSSYYTVKSLCPNCKGAMHGQHQDPRIHDHSHMLFTGLQTGMHCSGSSDSEEGETGLGSQTGTSRQTGTLRQIGMSRLGESKAAQEARTDTALEAAQKAMREKKRLAKEAKEAGQSPTDHSMVLHGRDLQPWTRGKRDGLGGQSTPGNSLQKQRLSRRSPQMQELTAQALAEHNSETPSEKSHHSGAPSDIHSSAQSSYWSKYDDGKDMPRYIEGPAKGERYKKFIQHEEGLSEEEQIRRGKAAYKGQKKITNKAEVPRYEELQR